MRSGGWQRLEIDRKARRARQPGGCRLDFSAIAKGHGVDRAADALKRLGLRHFLIEIGGELRGEGRSEEHTSELQSLMRISYAVFCLKKKNKKNHKRNILTLRLHT